MAAEVLSRNLSQKNEDHGPAILGVCVSTIVLAVVCVCLRMYIRIRLTHNFWWDDGFIIAAVVRLRALRQILIDRRRLTVY